VFCTYEGRQLVVSDRGKDNQWMSCDFSLLTTYIHAVMNPSSPAPGKFPSFSSFLYALFVLYDRNLGFSKRDSPSSLSSPLLCFGTLTLHHRYNCSPPPLACHWTNHPWIDSFTRRRLLPFAPPERWRRPCGSS